LQRFFETNSLFVKTELFLRFEFLASHSLSVREEPHLHLWRVVVALGGEPQNGMIISLPDLRAAFAEILAPLEHTFLNDNRLLDADAQRAPTCETLSTFFFSTFSDVLQRQFAAQNPTVALRSVEVAICEPTGFEWGSAKLSKE
jgi:6-pyruvoyl-tetrahydropterin synthase